MAGEGVPSNTEIVVVWKGMAYETIADKFLEARERLSEEELESVTLQGSNS